MRIFVAEFQPPKMNSAAAAPKRVESGVRKLASAAGTCAPSVRCAIAALIGRVDILLIIVVGEGLWTVRRSVVSRRKEGYVCSRVCQV